jgi:hypothetical protein
MKFTYLDPVSQWEYTFDFDNEWAKPGMMMTITAIGSDYGIASDRIQIHKDPIPFNKNQIMWKEYHLRGKDPLTSDTARDFAQRIVNLLVFS